MNIRHFAALPKPYLAYPKIIQSLILKPAKTAVDLVPVQYIVDQLKIDRQHLHAYNQLCGFCDTNAIPAIYLAVLSQSLQMHMMTKEAFPFPILGLVHIGNQLKQFRKIGVDEQLSLSCQFGAVQAHDKGMQFDFIIHAKVADELVMQGKMTYLSRQKTATAASNNRTQAVASAKVDYQPIATWKISENTGRRYALNSGDFNLIHLHALTAKAFGFKQAIAHGMWSNAKALASLSLPDRYETEVTFKLPIYLPSEVEFLTATHADVTDFIIRNQNNQKPHVVGWVKVLPD